MKKITENKNLILLIFVAIFGFSIGLFDNYRELWLNSNNISSSSISHIISVSYIVTVLVLFYFTIRINASKLKNGITIVLVLKMITSTILICLNNTNNLFLIKFLMFFDIAFTQLIVSSIYPLMMSISKNDLIYTKKETVTNIANKIGFLLVSILIGKTIAGTIIDYNICLLLSNIFSFIAFIIIINLNLNSNAKNENLDLKKAINYFNNHKSLYLYLFVCMLGGIAWSSILGMPLLSLTQKLGFNPQNASFFVLGMGIISNLAAIIIVKYLRHKNDHINLIFKFGIRVLLYLLIFLINNKEIMIITFIYLLLTDSTYSFIFDSHFTNNIKEDYSLLIVVLKYCSSLIGNAVGVYICGLLFNMDFKYLGISALIIGIIHYILCSILIKKKKYSLE